MADVSREFELRQLLKAYRKGLISDELFEEQMRELGASPATSPAAGAPAEPRGRYRVRQRRFTTEREMLLHFLDEFRAAETFGGVIFALWTEVANDPELKGGLRVVCEREAMHGRLLAARLSELGGRAEATLPDSIRESARRRLAARDVSDAEKVAEFMRRLPDAETAEAPIREVVEQITEDLDTRALLEAIIEDELATVRWLHHMGARLGVEPDGSAGPGA